MYPVLSLLLSFPQSEECTSYCEEKRQWQKLQTQKRIKDLNHLPFVPSLSQKKASYLNTRMFEFMIFG